MSQLLTQTTISYYIYNVISQNDTFFRVKTCCGCIIILVVFTVHASLIGISNNLNLEFIFEQELVQPCFPPSYQILKEYMKIYHEATSRTVST